MIAEGALVPMTAAEERRVRDADLRADREDKQAGRPRLLAMQPGPRPGRRHQ